MSQSTEIVYLMTMLKAKNISPIKKRRRKHSDGKSPPLEKTCEGK